MERNAQVYELVRAAIGLASERKDLASIFSRIDFQRQDARDYLRSAPGANLDVIYLDPMYSERHKSALPKKDLQQLRDWVGDDEDAQELFLLAKQSRVKRIVVKRADHAPALAPNVAHSFESKLVRYDLYLP